MIRSDRLDIVPVAEAHREYFVTLFTDPSFMLFANRAATKTAAHTRFDRMLALSDEVSFAKRPIVERSTGDIVGYSGVDRFDYRGEPRFEFGWRLIPSARGKGFATEASLRVLAHAETVFKGEILAMIDPTNTASANVARKVGFVFWKQPHIDGDLVDLYRISIESPSQPANRSSNP